MAEKENKKIHGLPSSQQISQKTREKNPLNTEQRESQNMKVKMRWGSVQERKHLPPEEQTSKQENEGKKISKTGENFLELKNLTQIIRATECLKQI